MHVNVLLLRFLLPLAGEPRPHRVTDHSDDASVARRRAAGMSCHDKIDIAVKEHMCVIHTRKLRSCVIASPALCIGVAGTIAGGRRMRRLPILVCGHIQVGWWTAPIFRFEIHLTLQSLHRRNHRSTRCSSGVKMELVQARIAIGTDANFGSLSSEASCTYAYWFMPGCIRILYFVKLYHA